MRRNSILGNDTRINRYSPEILKKIQEILSSEKSQRNIKDINFLYDTFGKLNYFQTKEKKFGIQCVRNFMKCMKYKEAEEGEILMDIEKIGSSCYFLIKGVVEVLSPNKNNNINNEDNNTNNTNNEVENNLTNKNNENINKDMSRINIIFDGNVFGEKLISDKHKT
jgi:hypothetical protein